MDLTHVQKLGKNALTVYVALERLIGGAEGAYVSIPELQRATGIGSRATVRAALTVLVDAGIIVLDSGYGRASFIGIKAVPVVSEFLG